MRWVLSLLCLMTLSLPALADRLIGFESASGYAPGELVGQPASLTPKWGGATTACFVTNAFGRGGGWCAQEYAVPTVWASTTYAITPADMGVPAFTTAKLFRISFWVNMAATAGSSGTAIQLPVGRDGDGYILRLTLAANGKVTATNTGTTALNNLLWNGGVSTGWVHFEVKCDYGRRVSTLYVNGVEKWKDIPFLGTTGHRSNYGTFGFNIQGSTAVWSTTVLRFDDIEFGQWPAPPLTIITVR